MGSGDLIDFVESQAGEYFRGSARYDDDTIDVLYLREDIREYRLRSQVDRMLERVQPESHAAEEQAFPFGDLYATIRLFDDATLLHFPRGSRKGLVVTLEPGAARDLTTFTSQCLEHIEW